MQIAPVLDSACLSRIGFTKHDFGCWWKEVPQGRLSVDAKTGDGRLKRGPDEVLNLHFSTVTKLKWFLDCLR